MRIKRIEIIGFKSFCDRTVLNFGEPIVGVVGPNGCGKSNIVDAIRWCMGEQSAKHLRGQAMGDVIFAGSENRGPAGMAEVSLTFEDVGFSHETLKLALGDEAVLTEPVLETVGEEAAKDEGAAEETTAEENAVGLDDASEVAPSVEAAANEVAAEMSVDAAEGAPAEGTTVGPDGEIVDLHAATREAQELLQDRPPAIDFAQYSEVTITRRLFRDGTSNYFLNKTPCRLRDITDFFLGTGVGTKAYSIIEQGRVGMIVSARAQDRRTIIEEAAGITKFKAKKKAAERKLEQTGQNLLRVTDIVAELDKRMGTLRRQAQKAERYRKYKTEIRDLELWIAAHRFLELLVETQFLEKTIATRKESLMAARNEWEAGDALSAAERAELSIEERALAGKQQELFELESMISRDENEVNYKTREANELLTRLSNGEVEREALAGQIIDVEAGLVTAQEQYTAVEAEFSGQSEDLAEKDSDASFARSTLKEAQDKLEYARGQLSIARSDLQRSDGQRDMIAKRREDASQRLDQVTEELGGVQSRADELESQIVELDQVLATLRQTRLDLGERTAETKAKESDLASQLSSMEAEVETLRTELHRRKSRLQSLIEINQRYEGFARGTRAIMQHAEHLGQPQAIRGLVADVIRAPQNLEVAVEAALGDRLGGVLVGDHHAGASAIQYLKTTSSGRSAFVACADNAESAGEVIFEDRTANPDSHTVPEGVMGSMLSLIDVDENYSPVARRLLSDTFVVESLEKAIDLHKQSAGQSGRPGVFVTLEGDVVDERGVVSGGSRDAQGVGVLAQKREIRELEEICASLEGDLADATSRFVSAKSEMLQVQKALEALSKEKNEGQLAMSLKERDLSSFRGEFERLRQRLVRLQTEERELSDRMKKLADDELTCVELEISAKDRIEKFEREQLGYITGVTEGQAILELATTALTEARVRGAQLGEKRASLQAEALRLEKQLSEAQSRQSKLISTMSNDEVRRLQLMEESAKTSAALSEMREMRRTMAEELSTARNQYAARLASLSEKENLLRQKRHEADSLASEVSSLEIKQERSQANKKHLEESVFERYRLDVASQLQDFHLRPQHGKAEEERLAELIGLIERMGGDINLTAIEEFDEVSKRFEFLTAQKLDLENAVGQLEKAISKINDTSRRLFEETFHAVNDRFKEMFPKLFRGGQASLAITDDGSDLLEAGIEIMAQPPGKKNTTVDQLSGGEKALTAVALLFAIFLIKPSPFCLLDEVDAPLDEANVDRYNQAVRGMTKRSQFIIISHNKRTMEVCDRLYGVTMQEPGCSKLVSVNLSKLESAATTASVAA